MFYGLTIATTIVIKSAKLFVVCPFASKKILNERDNVRGNKTYYTH